MELCQFGKKQRLVLKWWTNPKYQHYDAIICDGAIRSGKTFAESLSFVLWACTKFQNSRFAICGKTMQSVRRNVVTPLEETLRSAGFSWNEKISKNYIDIGIGKNVNRFYCFGGKDESSASMIQGMTLSGVLFDEVVLMPESFVNQALARCSVTGSKFWFNCNPASPAHWFYREWIEKAAEKNVLYLSFHLEDNLSLAPDIIARYEKLYEGTFYRRYVLGEWCAAQGQIYTMFSAERHVVDTLPRCQRYVVSGDYGTKNPCSFGLWGYDSGRDVWTRCREYYYDARKRGTCRTDEEHYRALVNLIAGLPIECIVIDPSAASFITCIERHRQFRVRRANNDVLSGIQSVCQALSAGKIQFHRSCSDLLREIQLYAWKSDADAPVKEFDHAMDDMRYFVQAYLCPKYDKGIFLSLAR